MKKVIFNEVGFETFAEIRSMKKQNEKDNCKDLQKAYINYVGDERVGVLTIETSSITDLKTLCGVVLNNF